MVYCLLKSANLDGTVANVFKLSLTTPTEVLVLDEEKYEIKKTKETY